jgi:hypothetical protein
MIDLGILKTEVETDPLGLGYSSGKLKPNKVIAEIMNTVPGTPGSGREVDKSTVTSSEIMSCIVSVEYDALKATDKEKLALLLSVETIHVSKPTTIAFLDSMFNNTTVTYANIRALFKAPVSRAISLFGEPVHYWDIAKALNNGNPDQLSAQAELGAKEVK